MRIQKYEIIKSTVFFYTTHTHIGRELESNCVLYLLQLQLLHLDEVLDSIHPELVPVKKKEINNIRTQGNRRFLLFT